MKVSFLKAYQGIHVNKAIRTSINGEEGGFISMEALEGFGVLVTFDVESSKGIERETVLVPFPNVAYARVEIQAAAAPKAKPAKGA